MTAVPQMNSAPIFHTPQQRARRICLTTDALLLFVIVLATAPLLLIFFRRLWLNEHYRFFPIVLAAFGWLVYSRWPAERSDIHVRGRVVAYLVLPLGFGLQSVGIILWSPWIHVLGAMFTTLFVLIYFGGGTAVTRLGCCWLLLWLVIPPPTNLDREFVLWLQGVSSRMSSSWLDAFGFNHVLSGHVIHVPGQQFLVEEACSGVNSFFVMLSLTAVFVIIARYPVVPSLLLITSAVGCAIAGNTFRISTLVVCARYGLDLSTGWSHTALGIVAFAMAIAILYSCDRLLLFLFAPTAPLEYFQTSEGGASEVAEVCSARTRLMGRFGVIVMIALFALIGVGQLMMRGWSKSVAADDIRHVVKTGMQLDESTIGAPSDAWTLVDFDRNQNEWHEEIGSSSWEYSNGTILAHFSLDFPFRGWHELSYCYRSQGWTMSDRQLLRETVRQDYDKRTTVAFDLENPTGGFGYVVMSLFDLTGQRLEPPPTTGWSLAGVRYMLMNRFTRRGIEGDEIKPVYQFQVFVTSQAPLTADQRAEILRFYTAARQQVIERIRIVSSG